MASLNYKWSKETINKHPEVGISDSDVSFGKTFFVQLLTFWVAYSHMIPISLYVIIEILKLGLGYLIN